MNPIIKRMILRRHSSANNGENELFSPDAYETNQLKRLPFMLTSFLYRPKQDLRNNNKTTRHYYCNPFPIDWFF